MDQDLFNYERTHTESDAFFDQLQRDVLRHPAGLDDTLVDLINTVAMSDTSPTAPADAVSRELMTTVAGVLAKLDALVSGDIAAINVMAAERQVAHVPG